MTGDELERAIQFLLESQGKNDAQIGQLGVRVDQIGVRVDQLTRDVAQLTASVARLTGDVARLTGDFADLKVLVKEFAESTRLFAQRADERLDRLEQNAERGDRHRQRLETALAEGAERMNVLMRVVEDHITVETRPRTTAFIRSAHSHSAVSSRWRCLSPRSAFCS